MRIAVIVAGIAGLVAACSLQQDGHEVTIYEQRQQPNAEGAGITLFGNAMTALEAVGLGQLIRDVSRAAMNNMHTGQRDPSGRWLVPLPPAAVASLYSVHRTELHRVLADQLFSGTLVTNKRALVTADGVPSVWVEGETITYDLVIVADGVNSANRRTLGLDTGVRYSGYTAWRGVTTRPVDLDNAAGETWGRGRIFGLVPLPNEQLYWFATLNTAAQTVFDDEWQTVSQYFGHWHAPIPACLAATPSSQVVRHDVYDLAKPLSSFTKGRVVLIGDAAHAMAPNLGQGAAQGIEDAATLTLLLRSTPRGQLGQMLAKYDRIRSKRATSVWRQSRYLSAVAQTDGAITTTLRDAAMRLVPGWFVGAASARMQEWSRPG